MRDVLLEAASRIKREHMELTASNRRKKSATLVQRHKRS
jgi:hypothetical protein